MLDTIQVLQNLGSSLNMIGKIRMWSISYVRLRKEILCETENVQPWLLGANNEICVEMF
jgi:hypothetical protein